MTAQLLIAVFRIYEIIVIVRVLFSWIRVDEYHPVVQWIYRLTEPLLDPLRRLLPAGGIDFSPMLLIVLLELAERVLLKMIFNH